MADLTMTTVEGLPSPDHADAVVKKMSVVGAHTPWLPEDGESEAFSCSKRS